MAAKLIAGVGKLAGELIWSGRFNKSVTIGGGVEHAGKNYEKGFGIFSDVGIWTLPLIYIAPSITDKSFLLIRCPFMPFFSSKSLSDSIAITP